MERKRTEMFMAKYTAYIRFTILLFMFLLGLCREGNPNLRR